jgi:hypothetical protein
VIRWRDSRCTGREWQIGIAGGSLFDLSVFQRRRGEGKELAGSSRRRHPPRLFEKTRSSSIHLRATSVSLLSIAEPCLSPDRAERRRIAAGALQRVFTRMYPDVRPIACISSSMRHAAVRSITEVVYRETACLQLADPNPVCAVRIPACLTLVGGNPGALGFSLFPCEEECELPHRVLQTDPRPRRAKSRCALLYVPFRPYRS